MNKPGERAIINELEKPLSSDINQIASDLERATREWYARLYGLTLLDAFATPLPIQGVGALSGFMGSSFMVRPSDPVSGNVVIMRGLGLLYKGAADMAVGGVLGVNDASDYKPVFLAEDEVITLAQPFPGAGQSRYDIIEVRTDIGTEEASTRLLYDSGVRDFRAGLVDKIVSTNLNGKQGQVLAPSESGAPIGYKVGVAAATGTQTEPAPSAGYRTLARILVGEGTATIDTDRIVDRRVLLCPYGYQNISFRITKTAIGKPVLSNINVPPGYIVLCGAVGAATVTVYIIGGGVISDVHVSASIVTAGGVSDNAIYVARCGGQVFGTASSGTQTTLLDATRFATVYKIAEGQTYTSFDLGGFKQVTALTDQSMPDPMVIHVNATVRHL